MLSLSLVLWLAESDCDDDADELRDSDADWL